MSYHDKDDNSPNTRPVTQSPEDALVREAQRQRRALEDAQRNARNPKQHQPMVMPDTEEL